MGSRQYVDVTIELMGNVLEHPSLDKSLNCLRRALLLSFLILCSHPPPLSLSLSPSTLSLLW